MAIGLDDFAAADGHTVPFVALLEASGSATLYADANRGGSDTPVDGSLRFVGSTISSVSWDGATLTLTDDDDPGTLDLGAYLGDGGGGNDLHLIVQTSYADTDRFSFFEPSFDQLVFSDGRRDRAAVEVADLIDDATLSADSVAFTGLSALMRRVLDNITTGTRFLIAMTRIDVVRTGGGNRVDFDVEAGDATGHRVNDDGDTIEDGNRVDFDVEAGDATGFRILVNPEDGNPINFEISGSDATGMVLNQTGSANGIDFDVEGETRRGRCRPGLATRTGSTWT